jgi:hypothetical protein
MSKEAESVEVNEDNMPPMGSYAFTAMIMAGLGGDDDMDWDEWKDDMKERDLDE